MTDNLRIVWRGMEPSEALEERIAAHVEALGTQRACRVTVDRPHRHHRHGTHYQVKIELGRVAISHDDGEGAEDPYAAVNAAFGKLARRLSAKGPRRRAVMRKARRGE